MKLRDQLNQMQTLMEQLVKMVGHNNAVTEELCQRMDGLETKVDNQGIRLDSLETKVDRLEAKVDSLETKVDRLETKVDHLEAKVDSLEAKVDHLEVTVETGFTDVVQMITVLGKKVDKIDATQALQSEMLRKLAADTAQHEAEITLHKRAK